MKKHTQKELVLEYVTRYGSIIPACIIGTSFLDGFFGSDIGRRARELRKEGKLISAPSKKRPQFEEFSFPGQDSFF